MHAGWSICPYKPLVSRTLPGHPDAIHIPDERKPPVIVVVGLCNHYETRKEGNTMNRNKLALNRTSKFNYMAPPRVAAVENDNISNQRQVVPGGRGSFLLAIPM